MMHHPNQVRAMPDHFWGRVGVWLQPSLTMGLDIGIGLLSLIPNGILASFYKKLHEKKLHKTADALKLLSLPIMLYLLGGVGAVIADATMAGIVTLLLAPAIWFGGIQQRAPTPYENQYGIFLRRSAPQFMRYAALGVGLGLAFGFSLALMGPMVSILLCGGVAGTVGFLQSVKTAFTNAEVEIKLNRHFLRNIKPALIEVLAHNYNRYGVLLGEIAEDTRRFSVFGLGLGLMFGLSLGFMGPLFSGVLAAGLAGAARTHNNANEIWAETQDEVILNRLVDSKIKRIEAYELPEDMPHAVQVGLRGKLLLPIGNFRILEIYTLQDVEPKLQNEFSDEIIENYFQAAVDNYKRLITQVKGEAATFDFFDAEKNPKNLEKLNKTISRIPLTQILPKITTGALAHHISDDELHASLMEQNWLEKVLLSAAKDKAQRKVFQQEMRKKVMQKQLVDGRRQLIGKIDAAAINDDDKIKLKNAMSSLFAPSESKPRQDQQIWLSIALLGSKTHFDNTLNFLMQHEIARYYLKRLPESNIYLLDATYAYLKQDKKTIGSMLMTVQENNKNFRLILEGKHCVLKAIRENPVLLPEEQENLCMILQDFWNRKALEKALEYSFDNTLFDNLGNEENLEQAADIGRWFISAMQSHPTPDRIALQQKLDIFLMQKNINEMKETIVQKFEAHFQMNMYTCGKMKEWFEYITSPEQLNVSNLSDVVDWGRDVISPLYPFLNELGEVVKSNSKISFKEAIHSAHCMYIHKHKGEIRKLLQQQDTFCKGYYDRVMRDFEIINNAFEGELIAWFHACVIKITDHEKRKEIFELFARQGIAGFESRDFLYAQASENTEERTRDDALDFRKTITPLAAKHNQGTMTDNNINIISPPFTAPKNRPDV